MIFTNLILVSASLISGFSYFVDGFGNPPKIYFDEKFTPEPDVTKVNIIFMNHLDVGYSDYVSKVTGFSANVINSYFNVFYSNAINLARQMRFLGYSESFRYTTHPWLLYFFLHCPQNLILANIKIQCPNAQLLSSMIQAIKDGDILWHDGPMNMNFENLNAFGLELSLNISANLNMQFGIKKPMRVVSLRDVPGLSQGVIRTMLKNNVVGISSGVNSGSAPPVVPKLCRWRAAPRSRNESNIPEIIYMQNPSGYPNPPGPNPNNPDGMSSSNCFRAPNSNEVLCFMFRSDNGGPPQSIREVLSAYEIVRARYVNAKLVAGTFEEFFTILWKNRKYLPVIYGEIGDTWIQGTASDPKKFARFRAMQREFQFYHELGRPMTNKVVDASRFLIKPAEHTYGLDSCGDSINWRNDKFQNIRKQPGVVNSELSWVEQRQYEQLVLDILGPNHELTKSILKEFDDLETFDAFRGSKSSNENIRDKNQFSPKLNSNFKIQGNINRFFCSNNTHSIVVGFQDGAISFLEGEHVNITSQSLFGKLIYHTYNETDTDYFLKYYRTYWNTGYGKPNSTINAHPESKEWNIVLKELFRKENSPCSFLSIVEPEDPRATTYYGFPKSVFILWDINVGTGEISTEVFWENKHPTRLMEAISLKFQPQILGYEYDWYLSKMGEPISPNSVLQNGSQWQHNVDDNGVFVAAAPDAKPILRVIPWDTGITCPIADVPNVKLPTVWPAPLYPFKEKLSGVAFNFYNNIWNTNYIYWYPFAGQGTESDHQFKARFTSQFALKTSKLDDTLRYQYE